jgi:spore germination protein KC
VRKITLCALAALLCLELSGCGYRELHQRVLIQAVGVDRSSQGYTVTVRAASSLEDSGDQLYTCQGDSVLEALSSLSLSTGREPFYAHNALVVFGRTCGETGIDDVMDLFIRYHDTRPGVQVYLAEGDASEVLSAKQDGAYLPTGELQTLASSGEYNGKAVSVDFLELVNSGERPGSSPVLPVLGVRGDRVEVLGTAYFQDYRWAGTLSLEETRGFLALKGDLHRGEVVVEDRNFGTVTLSIARGKTTNRLSFASNGSPAFQTQCKITADISTLSGGVEPDEEFYQSVEEAAAAQLQGEMASALTKALLKNGCDIFGFGNRISQQYPKRWASLDWDAAMSRCDYEIQVEVTVLRMEQGSLSAGGT